MCGIVGISLNGGSASRYNVEAMNAKIVHRGPDGAGVFVDGPTALAMRRLSIIDLDGGWQPIANEAGNIHVVQNGEIYNYKELRTRLQQLGHRFRTASDTETLVHAYEQWGEEFPGQLRGMFAFAIWDGRRRKLILGRDRLGIKPLYYAIIPQGLLFASELSSILAYPGFVPELNLSGMQQFLALGCAGPESSFLNGVRQLPPATVAEFSNSTLRLYRYWTAPVRCNSTPVTVEALRERLADAVRVHLVSDVPVGAFLSGGLDSSAVVGLMAQQLGTEFQTFSIGFEEADANELRYAQAVSRRWGIKHHFEIVRPAATEILDQLLDHFGEPLAESSALAMWHLSRLASQHVKVVLTGDGGDELFGGYTRYLRARRHLWIDSVPRMVRGVGRFVGEGLPEAAPAKHFLTYSALDFRNRYATEMQLFSPYWRRRILRPEVQVHMAQFGDPIDEYVKRMTAAGVSESLAEMPAIDLVEYLPNRVLAKVDRMTMAHSLEARPPFLDHKLVEFAATIPFEQKLSPRGSLKHLFKAAIQPIVDEAILNRPKAGFTVPLDAWFAGPLKARFVEMVLDGGKSLHYFCPDGVRALLNENQSGRRGHGERLWAILQVECWLRRLPRRRAVAESIVVRGRVK